MKILVILFALVVVILFCSMIYKKATRTTVEGTVNLEKYPSALYPIKKDGVWGYINNQLKIVITPQFVDASDFEEGMAAVLGYSDSANLQQGALYGFIDTTGTLVVGFKYDKVYAFHEGLAAVVKNGKYGYIDKTGKEIVPLQYEDCSSFSEGLAVVKQQGLNGFIDKHGRMVIQPGYARACWVSQFAEGLAPVYNADESAGYIDSHGKFAISPDYTYVTAFSEGLALVQPKGSSKHGYINQKGEMVISPQYDRSLPFSEGVATVRVTTPGGKVYFRIIDKNGKTIADHLDYDFVGIFKEGLAGVERNHRWGFIDKNGQEVIKPQFASVRLFRNGLSRIETGHLFTELQTSYINKAGQVVYTN